MALALLLLFQDQKLIVVVAKSLSVVIVVGSVVRMLVLVLYKNERAKTYFLYINLSYNGRNVQSDVWHGSKMLSVFNLAVQKKI